MKTRTAGNNGSKIQKVKQTNLPFFIEQNFDSDVRAPLNAWKRKLCLLLRLFALHMYPT